MTRFRHTLTFILGRIALGIVLVFVASFLVFLLTKLAPGGAEYAILGGRPTDAATVEAIREKFGLNDPWLTQYWNWLTGVLTGDFGRSYITGERITEVIGGRLGPTLTLTSLGALIAALVGIPLGVLAGLAKDSWLDRAATVFTITMVAVPSFVVAIVGVYVFSVKLGWFPSFGLGKPGPDRLLHLVLPVSMLALSGMGIIVRLTRAAIITEMTKDCVTFARSRGLSERRVIWNYGVRNALVPVITALGLILVGLVTGAVFIETVFAIPGLGTSLVNAVKMRDVPLVQGIVLLISGWVVLAHIIVDLLYVAIDPRIGFERTAQ